MHRTMPYAVASSNAGSSNAGSVRLRARQRKRIACKSRGLSLLEVILSIAILALALMAIGDLIATGFRSAKNAEELSEAQILCDTKMAEVVAGVLPLESSAGNTIEENPEWEYDVEIEPAALPGLLQIRVRVRQSDAALPVEFFIDRWMQDPDFDPEAEG